MTPKQRKGYRVKLLREVYDHKFDTKDEPYKISINEDEKDGELHLAIRYLIDNEYVANHPANYNDFTLKITYKGIDLIESIY